MKRGQVMVAALSMVLIGAGCATSKCGRKCNEPCDKKVSVRFVVPAGDMQYAQSQSFATQGRLVGDTTSGGFESYQQWTTTGETNPQHVVLWGGNFNGHDVTYTAAPLTPGAYMFGLFDQNRGTIYQGWIGVNNGGDDVLSTLTQWRDTVREQQSWLGFEYQIEGKFASRKSSDFRQYSRQLKSLERLERRINSAIADEMRDRARQQQQHNEIFGQAEVLLIPGQADYFHPCTQPTFTDGELNNIRNGKPLTKVVMVADYGNTMAKLMRVQSLRDEFIRCRMVLAEECKRLENRHHFLTVTDHLYNHGRKFVENERALQKARGAIAKFDHQIGEQRRHVHALMFVAGLFDPDQTNDAFQQEVRTLRRERMVLQEQQKQIELRFNQTNEANFRRVNLERERQQTIASIENLDSQIERIGEARMALAKLHETTGVIHRNGPAKVLVTSLFDDGIPAYLANAIESESLMTVRLETADGKFTPPAGDVAQNTMRRAITVSTRE